MQWRLKIDFVHQEQTFISLSAQMIKETRLICKFITLFSLLEGIKG